MSDLFADDLPGDEPLEGKLCFEEWADPEDQHTARLVEAHVTAQGRVLNVGDVITPRQARAERCRWVPVPLADA